MEIKFNLSLRQLCIIAAAQSPWNEEETTNITRGYFCCPLRKDKPEIWQAITKMVIKKIDAKALTGDLYKEVIHVACCIGKKMRDWFIYLKSHRIFRNTPRHIFYEHYFKKMYWTYYGTIDEQKIVRSWFNNPNCDLWKVYVMACCFCSEELIREIWSEVSRRYHHDNFRTLFRHFDFLLAAYWNGRFNNNLENFIQDIRTDLGNNLTFDLVFDDDDSITVNMFRLAVLKGFKAAKYFWLELTEDEKNENVKENLDKILNHLWFSPVGKFYRADQSTELLVSFGYLNNNDLNVITIITGPENLSEDFNSVLKYMTKWPWIDLLVPFICNVKTFLDERHYKCLFQKVVKKMRKESVMKNSIFQKTLYRLWRILPVNYKKSLSGVIVHYLYDAWDVDSLKMIINNIDLTQKREDLIKEGYFKYRSFLRAFINDERVEEFMNEIAILKTKDKNVQQNLKIMYQYLMKGEFDLGVTNLDNFCDSELSKITLKKNIDEYVICILYLTRDQFDLADKFLNWKFESKDLVTSYKYFLFFDHFFEEHIYYLWEGSEDDIENAKTESSNFLEWFSFPNKSEELKKRIVELLVTVKKPDGKRSIVNDLSCNDSFHIINNFLSWCGADEEKIRLIRNEYLRNGDLYGLLAKYMREDEIDLAESLLTWVPENERDSYMKEFLMSRDGILACKYFIEETCSATVLDPQPSREKILMEVKGFIIFWMKPVTNFNEFKVAFERWPIAIQDDLEEFGQNDSSSDSSGEMDGAVEDEEREFLRYNTENFNIFLDLLKSFIDNHNEFVD